MSRGEARTAAANQRQAAASTSGVVGPADGSEEQQPLAQEEFKDDFMERVVAETLVKAPPVRYGPRAYGVAEWDWIGGEKGIETTVLRRIIFNTPMFDRGLKVPVDAAIFNKTLSKITQGQAMSVERPMEGANAANTTLWHEVSCRRNGK